MTSMIAGEIGRSAAEGLGEMLIRVVGGRTRVELAEGAAPDWTVFAEGGWAELGVREADGGVGASVRDLVEVALVWGRHGIPLPLIPTLVATRWSSAARSTAAPLSIPVPTAHGVVVPYGDTPGLHVLVGAEELRDGPPGPADPFALLLRTVTVDDAGHLPGAALRELAVLWAAEAAGAARQALRESVEYVKERHQFGKPIGSFQAIKHRAAKTLELVERAETAVLWAAGTDVLAGDAPVDAGRLAAHAADTARQVVESCIQLHGGMGFTWELGLHVPLRHIIGLHELIVGPDGH